MPLARLSHRSPWSARLGFLAVYNALYAAAWLLPVADLLELSVSIGAFAATALLAMSVYLLDRVKPVNAMIDPADAAAHPQRRAFIAPRRGRLRMLVAAAGVLAIVLAWRVHPLAAVIVPLAHAGVLVYGSLPRRPRPKDVLIVKNVLVASALTALAAAYVLLDADAVALLWTRPLALGTVAAFAIVSIFVDAMLCDLDDAAADRRFGTHTLANTIRIASVWRLAFVLRAAAVGLLVAAAMVTALNEATAGVYSVALGGATLLIALRRDRPVRDAVDVATPATLLAAWVMLRAWRV